MRTGYLVLGTWCLVRGSMFEVVDSGWCSRENIEIFNSWNLEILKS